MLKINIFMLIICKMAGVVNWKFVDFSDGCIVNTIAFAMSNAKEKEVTAGTLTSTAITLSYFKG